MGRRAVIIVLDGVGAGGAPDAARFGDEGSNTLSNTARAVGGLELRHLGALGLGNVAEIEGTPPVASPKASHGLMQERAAATAPLAPIGGTAAFGSMNVCASRAARPPRR